MSVVLLLAALLLVLFGGTVGFVVGRARTRPGALPGWLRDELGRTLFAAPCACGAASGEPCHEVEPFTVHRGRAPRSFNLVVEVSGPRPTELH